jgi:hypothetical protein
MLRIKEQETRLNLHEHDYYDDDIPILILLTPKAQWSCHTSRKEVTLFPHC